MDHIQDEISFFLKSVDLLVIRTVLKLDMEMAAMEILIVMKRFGRPGVEISDFCGSALIMSRKSSSEPLIMAKLTSVTNLVIDLKGS
jgi:hypothetical protein